MANGTASRAMSIMSTTTPVDLQSAPVFNPNNESQQLQSSGATTVPDTDTDMAGTERSDSKANL